MNSRALFVPLLSIFLLLSTGAFHPTLAHATEPPAKLDGKELDAKIAEFCKETNPIPFTHCSVAPAQKREDSVKTDQALMSVGVITGVVAGVSWAWSTAKAFMGGASSFVIQPDKIFHPEKTGQPSASLTHTGEIRGHAPEQTALSDAPSKELHESDSAAPALSAAISSAAI
jgi:hypothetical protein